MEIQLRNSDDIAKANQIVVVQKNGMRFPVPVKGYLIIRGNKVRKIFKPK